MEPWQLAGEPREALELLKEVLNVVEGISNEKTRTKALGAVSKALVHAGDFPKIARGDVAKANYIGDEKTRIKSLGIVSEAMVQAENSAASQKAFMNLIDVAEGR